MNPNVFGLPLQPLWRPLAALVRLGLQRFWRQALPVEEGLLRLLELEAQELAPAGIEPKWDVLLHAMKQHWPRLLSAEPARVEFALQRLITEAGLPLPHAFLLTLLGEIERSHVLNLVIAELQAPQRQARPLVHLCTALLDSLFGPDSLPPLSLPDSILVRQHWLQLEGDGPLPLRTLRMLPETWNVLLGRAQGWPGCSVLSVSNGSLSSPKEPNSPFSAINDLALLPDSLLKQIPAIADLLAGGAARGIVVRGQPGSGRKHFSLQLAAHMQQKALSVGVEQWQKQPALLSACRYAGWLPVVQPMLGPGEVWRPGALPAGLPLILLLGTDGAVESNDLLEIQMPLPNQTQRQRLWHHFLEADTHDSEPSAFDANRSKSQQIVAELAAEAAANALLSGPSIRILAHQAQLLAQREAAPLGRRHLTQARRQMGAERLRLLAQPVEREVDEKAIVLPPLVASELERLIERARQRESLWQGLGASLQQTRTAGLRALFTGDSGTGKTLAASYIATRLGAPLYRVDLSAVMNKYIGESEKNLSALLDMAAASDVVLLFDEADSLFGRRSEGKETGERFANMLTHFLLTRIENHPGIVILTSNNRERIDAAFTRRLDLIVEFPQPGFEERLQLWHSHLGERGPGDAAYKLIAGYCNFAGGQLRNVVLTAAALAGEGPISCEHLLRGLEAEYRKIGRDVPAKLAQLSLMRNEA